ncbi:mRNA splicing protein [Cryptotrichosporon argae]
MLRANADEIAGKLSRSEQRQQKDLDAARKAGTAQPAVDSQGNAINPHIPTYITRAPWYADTAGGGPSLDHQRLGNKEELAPHLRLEQWYDRGVTAGPAAKKYRKGACENCGSMTHKRQDCVERPRKRGAKFTNKDIAADDVGQTVARDYDAKRDRWNGYDAATYKSAVVDEYEAAEEARRKKREAELEAAAAAAREKKQEKKAKVKAAGDDEFGSSDDDDDEEEEGEDKFAHSADMVGQKVDTGQRLTVRNLRIREDTAKYLLNLDPESAYYDPKTRSMRDAPEIGKNPEDMKFAGDNFQRYTGEATNMQKLQLFAWQSSARGHDVNMHANPTAGELLHREFEQKREVLKDTSKTSILERYGGEEHLERLPRELISGQTEEYVEYNRAGNVVKGRERAKARSKYDEDVFINNHTAVWGSWYDRDAAAWGFACCHSTISQSYCTGEAGKSAFQATAPTAVLAAGQASGSASVPRLPPAEPKSLVEQHREALRAGKGKKRAADGESERDGDDGRGRATQAGWPAGDGDEPELDRTKLRAALEHERRRRDMGEDEAWAAAKKGKADVTQEEIEAYRLARSAYDDPMANYKDPEE